MKKSKTGTATLKAANGASNNNASKNSERDLKNVLNTITLTPLANNAGGKSKEVWLSTKGLMDGDAKKLRSKLRKQQSNLCIAIKQAAIAKNADAVKKAVGELFTFLTANKGIKAGEMQASQLYAGSKEANVTFYSEVVQLINASI